MIAEIIFSAVLVYGAAAVYKGGKALFGGGPTRGLEGRDGKYHLNGKTYDTIEDYSSALWRQSERNRLRLLDESREISGRGESPEESRLRAQIKDWDEKGL